MKAVILAAGQGRRLRPHTLDRPKCLVELGGRPLLHYQLETLRRCGIDDVCVVTGYRADQIAALGLPTVHNPRYACTNMCVSLMCAVSDYDGDEDLLVGYGDIVYEPRLIRALQSCPQPLSVVVDLNWRRLWEGRMEDPLSDAETLRLAADGSILELGGRPESYDDIEGQYIGLIKIRGSLVRDLVNSFGQLSSRHGFSDEDREGLSMTAFLQHLLHRGMHLQAGCVRGGWLEVDCCSDLERYHEWMQSDGLDAFIRLPSVVGG